MLAVVYFTRYFKHYLLGKRFTLRTDHGSLIWLKNFKEPDGQIHRWIQQLSQFHMKIVHRPGNKHGNADAISRLTELPKELCKQCKMPDNYMYQGPTEVDVPCMKEGQQDEKIQAVSDEEVLEEDIESESPNLFPNNGSNSGLDYSNMADGTPILRRGRKVNRPVPAKQRPRPKLNLNYATLRKEQEDDSVIGKILKLKESNAEKPEKNEIIAESPELKFWLSRWEILEVKDGILCILWEDSSKRWRICTPKSVLDAVIWHLHDSKLAGHQGIKKTVEKAKICPFYWWGGGTRCKRVCTEV